MTQDNTPAPKPPKSVTPPLPKSVDLEGARRDDPRPRLLGVWIAAYAVIVSVCVILARLGLYAAEWAVGVAGTVVVVGVFVLAYVLVGKFFGPYRMGPLSLEERLYVEEHPTAPEAQPLLRAARVSRLLAGPKPEPSDGFVLGMSPEQVARFETNRAADAETTWEWAQRVGEPQVVHVTSDDGTQLTGHVTLANPASRRWMLFAHGYKGFWNESTHHARRFAERGYNVLQPEMRAHESSGGLLIGMGLLDRRDLVAWAQWLVRTYGSGVQIVLMGHSMGGSSVLFACGEKDLPRQVVATVSDCAYSDLWNVLAPIVREGLHLPAHPLMDAVREMTQRRLDGYDLADVDVLRSVKRSRTPILVIHGTADTFVPPYMAQRIFDAAGGRAEGKNKRLLMVEGAGHLLSCWVDPDTYYDAVFSFVRKYI